MAMSWWLAVFCVNNLISLVFAAAIKLFIVFSGSKALREIGINHVNTVEFLTLRIGWSLHFGWTSYIFFLNVHQVLCQLELFDSKNIFSAWLFVVTIAFISILDAAYENNPLIAAVKLWAFLFVPDFSEQETFLSFPNFIYFYMAVIGILTIVAVGEKIGKKTRKGLLY
jgi:hypothetical protein